MVFTPGLDEREKKKLSKNEAMAKLIFFIVRWFNDEKCLTFLKDLSSVFKYIRQVKNNHSVEKLRFLLKPVKSSWRYVAACHDAREKEWSGMINIL